MGIENYTVKYLEVIVEKHIPKLPKKSKAMIKKAIEDRLQYNPVSFGKPLRYSLKGHRRLRVADYRVVYRITDKQEVIIVAIQHRKDIYQ